MQIIKIKFLKDGIPVGKDYTYYSAVEVVPGNIVQINSSAKGIVTEVDISESEIKAYRDKVKCIVGKVQEESVETFDATVAILKQANYCRDHGYPQFAPESGRCFKCNQNIYAEGKRRNGNPSNGISVERAGRELITGCPHCNWSFCE